MVGPQLTLKRETNNLFKLAQSYERDETRVNYAHSMMGVQLMDIGGSSSQSNTASGRSSGRKPPAGSRRGARGSRQSRVDKNAGRHQPTASTARVGVTSPSGISSPSSGILHGFSTGVNYLAHAQHYTRLTLNPNLVQRDIQALLAIGVIQTVLIPIDHTGSTTPGISQSHDYLQDYAQPEYIQIDDLEQEVQEVETVNRSQRELDEEQERQNRERQEREQQEKQRQEREQQEKEQQEKERQEKEQQEKERKEKEQLEQHRQQLAQQEQQRLKIERQQLERQRQLKEYQQRQYQLQQEQQRQLKPRQQQLQQQQQHQPPRQPVQFQPTLTSNLQLPMGQVPPEIKSDSNAQVLLPLHDGTERLTSLQRTANDSARCKSSVAKDVVSDHDKIVAEASPIDRVTDWFGLPEGGSDLFGDVQCPMVNRNNDLYNVSSSVLPGVDSNDTGAVSNASEPNSLFDPEDYSDHEAGTDEFTTLVDVSACGNVFDDPMEISTDSVVQHSETSQLSCLPVQDQEGLQDHIIGQPSELEIDFNQVIPDSELLPFTFDDIEKSTTEGKSSTYPSLDELAASILGTDCDSLIFT